MMGAFAKVACATGALAMAATPALAEKARDLAGMVDQTAQQAERQLIDRGFQHVSSHRDSRGHVHSYWWEEDGDHCVTVDVFERSNRVVSINDAKDKDCGHSGGISGGEAAAIGVGAALLGALILGGKSHHTDGQEYDETQTAEFNRGYRDGLHHAPYHNYQRTDEYSHGFEKGADERAANLRDHKGRGGYVQTAAYADLKGARAAGADSTLQQRGFTNVDAFKSGNTAYSIWYRPQGSQCLQMTVAEGRVYDIRDIRQHPNCKGGGASSAPAEFSDLNGARASGGMSTLERRGFTQVDNFTSGNTRYSIQWRAASRQCLQVTMADGRFVDVRDIQQHPRCR